MHDNTLSQDNRDKFVYIAGRYNQQIKFYNVEETFADEIEYIKKNFFAGLFMRYSVATMFRLFLPRVISNDIKKVIYLDSDIIVNMNINDFWKIELENKPLAAVAAVTHLSKPRNLTNVPICRDGIVKSEDYISAGVLLMNLEVLRNEQNHINEGIKFIAEHPEYSGTFDQEIINYCFSKDYIKLPNKFNCDVRNIRKLPEKIVEENIYHYIGAADGFGMNTDDIYNRLFFDYFVKTPWFNSKTFGNIYSVLKQFNIRQKAFATYVTAMMSGKTRAFYINSQMSEGVKNIFGVRADEEIIFADEKNSVEKMINLLRNFANKKVLFILVNDPQILQLTFSELLKNGFVENRDFINAVHFLSDAQGVPLNSYNLVKLM